MGLPQARRRPRPVTDARGADSRQLRLDSHARWAWERKGQGKPCGTERHPHGGTLTRAGADATTAAPTRCGGRGGKTSFVLLTIVAALVAAAGATAKPGPGGPGHGRDATYLTPALQSAIAQNPKQAFNVILQGDPRGKSVEMLARILDAQAPGPAAGKLKREDVAKAFKSIDGLKATLTGDKILRLAKEKAVATITSADELVKSSGPPGLVYTSKQKWTVAVGAQVDWLKATPTAPTIAIVDSGVDGTRSDFGSNFLGQVNLSSLTPNATGDGYGHGTFVAGIAAGRAPGYAGAAPTANILSVRVMNDQGMTTVGDVITACDWILSHKAEYNIRVVNLSLHATTPASILFDPLDIAVESLWLNGIVVVAASGNYGTGDTPSGVLFAPGNDPFVITVGAVDVGKVGRGGNSDDMSAPWSAWGYTPDGFMKPELGAPGRYMVGPVTTGAGLAVERPGDVVAPGYMQLSGTSFAAPVVSATAAMLLAVHPDWTPDQVKGVLMLTTKPEPGKTGQMGVGEVSVKDARKADPDVLPNPNAGLDQFVTTASDGTSVFDSVAWQTAAWSSAAWSSAAWSSAAWSSAAWSSAAWSSAAWSSAAWSSAAYGTAAWSSAAWSSAAWSDAAWSDGTNAEDAPGIDAVTVPDDVFAEVLAELGITSGDCDPTISVCEAPVVTPPDTTPAETTPADTAPADTTPVDTSPADTTPVDTTPVDTTPVDTTPSDSTPADPTPVDTSPADMPPADPTPVDTSPVDATPPDTTPVDTTPVDTSSTTP